MASGIESNLLSIIALCENPHWTADRKHRIADLARESLSDIRQHKATDRRLADLDDEHEPGNTDGD